MKLQKYIVIPRGASSFVVEAYSTDDIRVNIPNSYVNMNNIVVILPLDEYNKLNK